LRELEIPIAVASNAYLILQKDIRKELLKVEWVSLKIYSVAKTTWRKLNRPYRILQLGNILNGIREFAGQFSGEFVTKTTLIKEMYDDKEDS
jgi:wyosine [tRNA(Phe)-imidazoG37] synthetase (radical SAM superfamily)